MSETPNWFPPPDFDHALGRFRRAVYIFEMARWKRRIKPTTKQRMMEEVIAAAKVLGEIDPDFIG
jgi:hypothetical protein